MIGHLSMVFEAGDLNASEKILLLAYCNHTDAHGYTWAGVPRLSDETGMHESTVQRTNKLLRARGLIKSVRRFNPTTGKQITNLTRVNLELLASMKRPQVDYSDNLIEEITFSEDDAFPQVVEGPQSATPRGGNLPPSPPQSATPRGGNLPPNPSSESSRESSSDPWSGAGAATAERTESQPAEITPPLDAAAAIANRLDLAKLDAHPSQVRQIIAVIAEVLARPGIDQAAVERYAAAKVAEGHTVKYLLQAFSPRYLAELKASARPGPTLTAATPRCGNPRHDPNTPDDDRNLYDPDDDGPGTPCPRCHPAATLVAITGRGTGEQTPQPWDGLLRVVP